VQETEKKADAGMMPSWALPILGVFGMFSLISFVAVRARRGARSTRAVQFVGPISDVEAAQNGDEEPLLE